MAIIRYSPFKELAKMERDLDKYWQSMPDLSETAAMDMYEQDGKLKVELSLPSFAKEDLNVTLSDGELDIAAKHTESEEDKSKKHYYFRESHNQYERHVSLPEGVKTDKAAASYKDGVLTITMPITATKPTRKVAVA